MRTTPTRRFADRRSASGAAGFAMDSTTVRDVRAEDHGPRHLLPRSPPARRGRTGRSWRGCCGCKTWSLLRIARRLALRALFDRLLVSYWPLGRSNAAWDLRARQRRRHVIFIYERVHARWGCQGWRLPKYVDHGGRGGCRTSLIVLEQKMYVGPWQEYGPGAGAPRRGARHAGGDPGGRRVGAPAAALELVSGELPADKAARSAKRWRPSPSRAASAPRPLLEPARGAAATGARRPTGQAAPARADVATPGRRSRRRGDLSSRHPRPVDGCFDRREKTHLHTPHRRLVSPTSRTPSRRRSPRGAARRRGRSRPGARGPRLPPSTGRAEATTGVLERDMPPRDRRRESRAAGDSGATPRRTSLASKVAGARRRKQFARERRRPPAPRPTPEARRRRSRQNPRSSDERSALGDGSILPPAVRGAVRVRARARAAGAAAARPRPTATPVEPRAAGSGPCAGVPRGRSPRRRRSAATFRASADGRAPAESAPAPGGAAAK